MKGKIVSVIAVLLIVLSACAGPAPAATATTAIQTSLPPTVAPTVPPTVAPTNPPAIKPTNAATAAQSSPIGLVKDKIKHIIIIMQENRSFDEYFGTFPGANGIPMQNGVPTVCSPDPQTGQCIKPYHNPKDVNSGGPHAATSAAADINGGKMNGFVAQFREASKGCKGKNPDTPGCVADQTPDVMGWHDAREIPNYWTYAENFVLQDAMFEPNASWSLPAHLFMVSA